MVIFNSISTVTLISSASLDFKNFQTKRKFQHNNQPE